LLLPEICETKGMSTPRKAPASAAAKPAAKAAPRTAAAKPAAKPAAKAAPKAPAKPVASKRPAAKAAAKPAAKVAPKPAAKAAPAKAVISTDKRYKFLSGIDDSNFCQRVSDHLDAGYELYGSPTMVVKGSQIFVGQAIVLKKAPKSKKKGKK
jgi:hypothetical protein